LARLLFSLLLLFSIVKADSTNFTIGLTGKFLETETIWISSPYHGAVESELCYPNTGYIIQFNLHAYSNGWIFNLNGLGEPQKFYKREGYDSDYMRDVLTYKSIFKSGLDIYSDISVDLGYQVDWLQFYLSYCLYNIKHTMTELEWIIWEYYIFAEPYPSDGLRSKYEILYSGFGVGLGTSENVGNNLQMTSFIKYYPISDMFNEGYWNLRELRFHHRASNTERLILDLKILYNLSNKLQIGLGYYYSVFFGVGKNTCWIEGAKPSSYKFPVNYNIINSGPTISLNYRLK